MDISQKAGYKEPTARVSSSGKEIKHTLVVSNADTTDGMENRILEHADTPQYGDAYPYDDSLTVTDVQVGQTIDDNFLQWEVEVTYGTATDDDGGSEQSGNWTRNLSVSGRTQQYEVPLEAGYNAKNERYSDDGEILVPVVSTSNEPLLVAVYKANIVLDISQNVSRFDFDWMRQFKNSTNASKRKICGLDVGVGQARILDLSGSNQTDTNGNDYYATTLSIEVTDDDFIERAMNKGFWQKDPDSAGSVATKLILKKDIGEAEDGTDEGNMPVNEPVRLRLDNTPYQNGEKGANYVSFKAYPSLSWSVLNIPSSQP